MLKTWLLYFVLVLPGGQMEIHSVGYFFKSMDCNAAARQTEREAFLHMKKARPEIIALDANCIKIDWKHH